MLSSSQNFNHVLWRIFELITYNCDKNHTLINNFVPTLWQFSVEVGIAYFKLLNIDLDLNFGFIAVKRGSKTQKSASK